MERVEWTRLEGNDVEAVVSMLLCLEYPDATRVRPGRGDQGLDVLVPLPGGGVAVYQVKRHAENLTASRRAKLAASHDRMAHSDYAAAHDIRAWHPTMPLDPTVSDIDWMESLVKDQPWDSAWKGLAFIEALITKHPKVVDYYLHGGRARADETSAKITDLLRDLLALAKGGPPTPGEVASTLGTLFEVLDESDPFYAYGISVDPSPPDLTIRGALHERTVAAVQRGLPGPPYVTITIIARSNESVVERPVTLDLELNLEGNEALRGEFKDFLKYGGAFHSTGGTVTTEADLPGGLGGRLEGGTITITPVSAPEADGRHELRMRAIDPEGAVLAECLVRLRETTQGPEGSGSRAVFDSAEGVFSWEWRADHAAQTVTAQFTFGPYSGALPGKVVQPLRLLAALRGGNTLQVSLPHGPAHKGHVYTAPFDGYDVADQLALIVALIGIQEHTTTQLRVPDLSQFPVAQLRQLERAAALLRGDTIRLPLKTTKLLSRAPSAGAAPQTGDLVVARSHQPLLVNVGGDELDLGWIRVFYTSVRIGEVTSRGEYDEVPLEATEASQIVMHWVETPDALDAPDSPDVADAS